MTIRYNFLTQNTRHQHQEKEKAELKSPTTANQYVYTIGINQ